MKLSDKWLMDCTNDEIKKFAASFRTMAVLLLEPENVLVPVKV